MYAMKKNVQNGAEYLKVPIDCNLVAVLFQYTISYLSEMKKKKIKK